MDEANFKIDRAQYSSEFPSPDKVKAELSGHHEIYDQDASSFIVRGHFKVVVRASSGSEIVDISCTIGASFALDKEAKKASLERFMQNEARLVFWPYLRHFIADSTYRMAIYPLVLPLTSEVPTNQQ
jgi:preprotein translocase subunit SecB